MQNIEQLSNHLKTYITQFDIDKAIPLWIFFLNCQMKTDSKFIHLTSIVRQMAYLINLGLSDNKLGKGSIYDFSEIEEMLDNIEGYYKEQYDHKEAINYYGEDYRKNLVTQTTYLNYYLNTPLVYIEQVIDRIQRTFLSLDDYINESIGVNINDLLSFYLETTQISTLKFRESYSDFINQNVDKKTDGIYCYPNSENESDIKFIPFHLVHQQTFSIDDYTGLDKYKIEKILSILSFSQTSDLNYLYYTDYCELLSKPIIRLSNNRFILFHDNQLINSIYDLLCNVCKKKSGRNSNELRAIYLEEKTVEVFTEFFPKDEIIIYTNYYINGEDREKDIFILYRRSIFIIECKSDMYKEPFRDINKSYKRIEREFRTSIQKAYDQAKEVQQTIYHNDELTITDKNKNTIGKIRTNRIENVFIILVTQERFGQIECDLGLLLDKEEDDFYPWAVSIDDLESILLTIYRKENAVGEFITYLINREKLHERLICSDELDIVGYFIMQRQFFIKDCNRNEIYVASPDFCQLFDNLYHGGFGFKNELYLENKLKVSISTFIISELCQKLKLRTPKKIQEFKKAHNLNNEAMNVFKKNFYNNI